MAYVAMGHQSTGYIVPASDWNQMIDNIAYLKTAVNANIWLSGSGGWAAATAGAAAGNQVEMATNKQTLKYISFVDAADSFAEWGLIMPADYNGGTITAAFYWMHPATTVNFGVGWGLKGRAYGDNEALDQAWGTEVVTTDTGGTTSNIYISAVSGNITLAGTPVANEFVQFRTRRAWENAGDTMAVAAYLLGILLTYTRS